MHIFATQRGPAGLVTCLAHWNWHSMKMYSIPCDVPLPTRYYASLFLLLGVQEDPIHRPEKKRNTADVDLLDRARSFFRSRNARGAQGRSTTIEGLNLFENSYHKRQSPPQQKNIKQKKKQRPKEKKTRTLLEGRYPPCVKNKN